MNKFIDKNLKLTEHFSLSEMCSTSVQTADHNFPTQAVITNLRRLCGWLEQLRARKNQPAKLSTPLHLGGAWGWGLYYTFFLYFSLFWKLNSEY